LFKKNILFFLVLLVFVNPVYGEKQDIVIDWLIEGQMTSKLSSEVDKNIPSDSKNILQNNEFFTEFVTKNQYSSGDYVIDINSKEGQLLNKLLIEQQKLNKESFFHMIQYLDRYSDGYIELAEALLDPVSIQNYQKNGRVYDSNIDSNLAYFLLERGYSLDDLDSVPNDAFSPTKYTEARAMAAQIQNNGDGTFDLRTLIPNYVEPDSKSIHEKMIDEMSAQTLNVFNSVLSNDESHMVEISVGLFDESFDEQFENSKHGVVTFENTRHAIDLLNADSVPSVSTLENYAVLILIPVVIGLIIMAYMLQKKSKPQLFMPVLSTIPTLSTNYQNHTQEILNSAMILFKENAKKEAFEKFSQAIRFYYSHKLKINMEMTAFEIISQLKKHDIDNFDDVQKWLTLCAMVEFTKYDANKKEFNSAVSAFSKLLS